MQGQDTDKNKVVSLFAERQKAQQAQEDALNAGAGEPNPEDESFEDVMARNLKNQERLAKERANANKSVLRSYRIKH